MKEYVVYRHGWNANNQRPEAGLPEKMPVARIWAKGPEDACRRALSQVTVQPNQYLSAEPADEVDARGLCHAFGTCNEIGQVATKSIPADAGERVKVNSKGVDR